MRVLRPYLSISEPQPGKFKVYVLMKLDPNMEAVSHELEYLGVHWKTRPGEDNGIWCSKFQINLKTSFSSIEEPVQFESTEFIRDTIPNSNELCNHIWVQVNPEIQGQNDSGSVGNYEDPDG